MLFLIFFCLLIKTILSSKILPDKHGHETTTKKTLLWIWQQLFNCVNKQTDNRLPVNRVRTEVFFGKLRNNLRINSVIQGKGMLQQEGHRIRSFTKTYPKGGKAWMLLALISVFGLWFAYVILISSNNLFIDIHLCNTANS